ncbi:zinc finger protein Rlf [Triplophysa dalaica]|uniref:zinc finger protein Rlf n=1 Tax=Triplophysa dalaica TaxID=1582913 RepID=UPI0024E03322|nr:zinc finger protein Rlf [Triplophysa dalaica]
MCAYAPWLPVNMADENAEAELDWSGQPTLLDEDTFFAMEGLQATLQQLEAELRQKDISEQSSTEYCDNFCQALMHFAGSRNSVEDGLALLEVYCLSINCFAAARPHLTADSPSVTLVLKRLALSCLELLLSVPHNEIPLEAWLQFHGSVQAAHEAMLQYGSTDLQALLNITGEGGAWNNPVLVSLLTGQPTDPDEVNDYLVLEGEGFMEMRIKHLEKVGEVEKALILNKACANCSLLPNQATFRQTFVTQLCQMLPSEEAIIEICRIDGKDVLDLICNMETEGDENTAFILCTTYFTQQLQQESLYCAWELTLLWSKLQRRIDTSLESFFERCLQFGAIAKTIYHLLFLIRVIQTEAMQLGLAISVELCVKAFRLPRQEELDASTMVCKTVACLLPEDLEVRRACQLTEFLLSPCQEAFNILEELYAQPDQKYDEENGIIPNFLRCELLLSLKAHWPFDPEFWDWKTLKRHCVGLLGQEPEEEVEDEAVPEEQCNLETSLNEQVETEEEDKGEINELGSPEQEHTAENADMEKEQESLNKKNGQQYKVLCKICHKEMVEVRICHHAKKHVENDVWTCPVCLQKFKSRPEFVQHSKKHIQMPSRVRHFKKKKVKKKVVGLKNNFREDGFDDLEPGQIPLDPSLAMYYQSTHDPVVLEHILEQAASVPKKQVEDDYITFDYISTYFKLQDRDVYQCPATACSKNFKLFKYLGVHLKNEHDSEDPNVKHYLQMKDCREKCTFCRKTFMTPYHHRTHRQVHYGEHPYICVVAGCGARFDTTTELVVHKQSHGFRLSYRCELKGCSFSYCDLGQLYHHEAQHFRDAAYTCTGPGCKQFFYSCKEFVKHLATHGITFTDKDFEMQRKVKRKVLLPVVGDNTGSELENNAQKSLSSPRLECSESKATLTCVAVCFDGKKFTCGLKRCGRNFTTTRELQRHLKNAHKDEFNKEDNLCKKKVQTKESQSQDNKLHKNNHNGILSGSSSEESNQEKAVSPVAESVDCDTALSNVQLSATLSEIMQGFSQLSITSSSARHAGRNSHRSVSASNLPVFVLAPTLNVKSPAKAPPSNKTELRSHVPASDSKRIPTKETTEKLDEKKDSVNEKQEEQHDQPATKPYTCEAESCCYQSVSIRTLMQHYIKVHHYSEEDVKEMNLFKSETFKTSETPENSKDKVSQQDQSQSEFLLQATTKPYTCEAKSCQYQSVASQSLRHHYIKIHGYSEEVVKEMEVFKSQTFRPFKCHLCSKNYRNKKQLKIHYINIHHIKKAIVAQMSCTFKGNLGGKAPLLSSSEKEKSSSKSFKTGEVKAQRSDNHIWQQRCQKREGKVDRKNGKVKSEKTRPERSDSSSTQEPVISEGKATFDDRGSSRPVTKGNLSYILNKYNKSFHCVHNNCKAAFSARKGLARHLKFVHHYNPSKLCFPCDQKGCDKQFSIYSSLARHYRKEHNLSQKLYSSKKLSATSEEPIPMFKCTYANCNQSYHLKSSLLRHTSQFHQNQSPDSDFKPSYNKQVFYQHCDPSDSLVVRLQSNPKKDESISGCQTKLIISPPSQQSKDSPPRQSLRFGQEDPTMTKSENFEPCKETKEETDEAPVQLKSPRKSTLDQIVYRAHEEALQMCQDRCQPAAFPCMVQNCDSVVTRMSSLHRHYIRCHKFSRKQLMDNADKLCYTTEQLEEIIQTKSAVSAIPDLTRIPSGVLKMEYQSEPATPGGPSLPMSLHSIKTESMGQDAIGISGEPCPDSGLLIAADDLLYRESSGHPEELILEEGESHKEKSELTAPPLIRPPPLDLSPPSTIRIAVDDNSVEPSVKDNCNKTVNIPSAVSISVPNPTRQPLRWKNELSEPPPMAPHSPISKDPLTHSLAPQSFDIGTYKPMGFESSFLKFIKEKEEEIKFDRQWTAVVTTPCLKPDPPRRRDCFRRSCSVKENNRSGAAISRNRKFRSSPLRHLISKGDCTSIQNLRLILERALRGCGDQAIKQLQFLKPVVVLERPKSSASILDLLPSETKV